MRAWRRRAAAVAAVLLLAREATSQVDCTATPTFTELRSRPWLCEPPGSRTTTDDLSACLGAGHQVNRTDPGLCRGRWQWYQVSTVHGHDVPYYDIIDSDGSKQHVRGSRRVEGVRHALALDFQTEFCPHTPECGLQGQPQQYYTTVDVLVVDGEPRHPWNSERPFDGFPNFKSGIDGYYAGDRYGQAFRYYTNRRSLALTFGFHMNGTQGCAPTLSERVNIGVYCSWVPQNGFEDLANAPCAYRFRAHLVPETVYDGYDATYPLAPAGARGHDSFAPQYLRDEGIDTQPDPAAHYFRVEVGAYDTLNVSVERSGRNLTWLDASGGRGSNGHGLTGVVVRRRASLGCPTAALRDQRDNLTDLSEGVVLSRCPAECLRSSWSIEARAPQGSSPPLNWI